MVQWEEGLLSCCQGGVEDVSDSVDQCLISHAVVWFIPNPFFRPSSPAKADVVHHRRRVGVETETRDEHHPMP